MKLYKLINFARLSDYITGNTDPKKRQTIRYGVISKKYYPKLDDLFFRDLPAWWESYKDSHQ